MRTGRRLRVVLCGNEDRLVAEAYFTECPRCGAMADGLLDTEGEIFAADCSKCKLSGSTGMLTIWDLGRRRQVETPTPLYLQRAINIVVFAGAEAEVWQGDVKVAHFAPKLGLHTYLGRCEVEEQDG